MFFIIFVFFAPCAFAQPILEKPFSTESSDSLSPKERKALEDQKQHNLKVQLLAHEWSKAHPEDLHQGLVDHHQHIERPGNLGRDEPRTYEDAVVRRVRLMNQKEELISQYRRLRDFFTYSEPSVPNRFNAGPQNGESDIPDHSGASARQFTAELESVTINRCNQMNELRLEIERITRELDGSTSDPPRTFINWKAEPHPWWEQ